ncbi:hypothetical protein SEPCBS57363_000181 [Sporothrix epigloea]|uniref:Methyltransferase domain-containing protein n=1 Tax=Sporothrix epigloea TaxID=1892477 RepID=A0ABP0D4B6_9PEZI
MASEIYPLNEIDLLTEIERLDWNHTNVLVPVLGGHVLPPEVDAYLQGLVTERTASSTTGNDQPVVSVADIATGTGIWLVDVAKSLPPTARLDGFDYNTSKFRPTSALPPNVQLQEANALKPFPAKLHGQYDLVHVRLIFLALRTSDWAVVAANLRTLLRPGGYLLWEEVDSVNWKGYPASTQTAKILANMTRFYTEQSAGGTQYPIGLDQLLNAEGYDGARQEVFKLYDNGENTTLNLNRKRLFTTAALSCLRGYGKLGGIDGLQTEEEAAKNVVEAEEEVKKGEVQFGLWIWRTIARRSL